MLDGASCPVTYRLASDRLRAIVEHDPRAYYLDSTLRLAVHEHNARQTTLGACIVPAPVRIECVDCGSTVAGRVKVHDAQTEPRCAECAASADAYYRLHAADPTD